MIYEKMDQPSSITSQTPVVNKKEREVGQFLQGLGLPSEKMALLNRINQSAPQIILKENLNQSAPLSEHKTSVDSLPKESVLLGKMDKVVNHNLKTSSESLIFDVNAVNKHIKDLDEFSLELPVLFGKDPEMLKNLEDSIQILKKNYKEIQENPKLMEEKSKIIDEKRNAIKNKIVDWTLKQKQASAGLQILANLLKGFQVKRLLNQSMNTQEVFESLIGQMKKLKEFGSNFNTISDPSLRKEAFRHIKILKEKSKELLSMEKQSKSKLAFLNPTTRKQQENVQNSYNEFQKITEQYEMALAFVDNEPNDFKDLSIESKHPRREHLLMYANDIFKGAKQLISKQRTEGHKKILKQVQEDSTIGPIVHEKIFKKALSNEGFSEKELNEYPTEFKVILPVLLNEYKTKLQILENKLATFKNNISKLEKEAESHPNIGNNKPLDLLSKDPGQLKIEQGKAKTAINELFQELKLAYMKLSGERDEKIAAEDLTKARNDVLGDKTRWEKPIVRTIEFSNRSVEHKMSCMNSGYPSSNFRGRVGGPECIQPNLHKVEISNSQGKILSSYSSSATNVEFFQDDPTLRGKATLQQTGEVLLGKVDTKLASLSEKEIENEVGSKENPVVVDVMTTLLLSPDTLRDWLVASSNDGIKTNQEKIKDFGNKVVSKFSSNLNKKLQKKLHMDPSQLEKRMLEESIKAWMAFDNQSNLKELIMPMAPLTFKDGRVLSREVVDGKQLFYLTDPKNEGKRTYIQFEISCYNVGCNKMTKLMTNTLLGKSIETVAKKIFTVAKFFGMPITKYTGDLGNKLEEDINAKAFQKDTKRYENKIIQMNEEKQALYKQLNEDEKKIINSIETAPPLKKEEGEKSLSDLSLARKKLEDIERSPKATPQEKQEAFRNWQQIRNEVGKSIETQLKKAAPGNMKKYLEIMQHKENLRDLYNEIKDQFELKDYRSEKGMDRNMYTLPSALVAFGIELGANPHTGCRSGKDRTSLQRMEVGTRVLSKEVNGRYLNYREIEEAPETYEIREQMLLNSGHIDDLAYLNIGSSGLNLSGAHGSYLKHIDSKGKIYNTEYENDVLFGVKGVFSINLK